MAIVPVAEKYKMPLVSCAASYKIVHDEKTGKPYKWVFKTPQTDTMAVEAIYTHTEKKRHQQNRHYQCDLRIWRQRTR